MDETERRLALADFLRTRRARLHPAEVGLPARSRRRTPGLRREEVAELANIGVAWYALLEQGRDVHPSRRVLESLAGALRLTSAEAQHLFRLAAQELPAKADGEGAQVTPALQQVLEALDPHPAFIIGGKWDVLAWNRAGDLLFDFSQPCPPYTRNILWRYFHQDDPGQGDPDWEAQAQNLVAQFRADYARFPGDPFYQALLADLQKASPQFRLWWEQQDVRRLPEGPRILERPGLGRLEFEHMTFQTSLAAGLHIKVFVARPGTAAKLAAALAHSEHG
jgi:transcriptional regulator with XRE-family HTH domain